MSHELVKRGPAGEGAIAPLPVGVSGDAGLLAQYGSRLATSLKLDDPEDQALFIVAQEKGEQDGKKAVNLTLEVSHFLLRDAQRRNLQSKELESCPLLTLIGPGGECWSTTSQPAIRSFFMLASLWGLPPWNPARELRVKAVKTSLGTDTYILTLNAQNGKTPKPKKQANS